ncbi:MAG: hypothetical protein HGA87_05380, partial [Desulfobulbaceae bacterium]|nr:hypothetical protein [Desulfobulbaceae bacterium]
MQKFFFRVSSLLNNLDKAAQDLSAGVHRHEVLESSMRDVEETTDIEYVGRGGIPDVFGNLRHDGAFMDGNTRAFAGIANVRFLPSKFARLLMERYLHTSLVGEGAEIFARDFGLTEIDLAKTSTKQHELWLQKVKPTLDKYSIIPGSNQPGNKPLLDVVEMIARPDISHDTVIMMASDGNGLSAAASTTGWGYKHPGRVGDTPICGAGLYVDSRFGGACCTHTGEMSSRDLTSKLVVTRLMDGFSVEEAVMAGVNSLADLKNGVLGGLVIYAVDRAGKPCVKSINVDGPVKYFYWNQDMQQPECRDLSPADRLTVSALRNQ